MAIRNKALKYIENIFLCFLLIVSSAASGICEEDEPSFDAPLPVVANTMKFTGAASLDIPIAVPLGRLDMQPTLALSYNSYGKNSWIGKGWGIEVGAVQRSTKRGVNYNGFDFTAGRVELVPEAIDGAGNGTYKAKIEGDFSRFEFNHSTGWIVTEKSGRKLFYGQDVLSRQDDLNNSSHIFKWCLDKVVDTNANYITFSYEMGLKVT